MRMLLVRASLGLLVSLDVGMTWSADATKRGTGRMNAFCSYDCTFPPSTPITTKRPPCKPLDPLVMTQRAGNCESVVLPAANISGCLYARSQQGHCGDRQLAVRYRHVFHNRSVLIVGDSMARQLFMTVVGRLRGHSAIFDQQLFDATYVQPSLSQPDQLTVGSLRSPPADLPVGAAWVGYTTGNCFEHAADKDLPKLIAGYTHVVILQPAFHPITKMCRSRAPNASVRALLPEDPTDLDSHPPSGAETWVQFWRSWRDATRRANTTSTLLLTTPVEHIRSPFDRSEQVVLNALSLRTVSSFGPSSGWHAIDFANLTATLQPDNLVGNNWHYVCSLYPYYGKRGRIDRVLLVQRLNGRCDEEANSRLWQDLVEPALCRTGPGCSQQHGASTIGRQQAQHQR